MQLTTDNWSEATAISIVVPSFNAAATLGDCLRALVDLQLDEPYEIIAVDDGSTDETPQIAESFGHPVLLVRRPHRGAAAARNAGVRIAHGEIILFTDADCRPTPQWARALVSHIRSGADGAKGTYRTCQRSLVARFVQAEYESKYRHMEGRARIDFVDTYSAAYRRDVLLEAGGFNENLPVDEDQELSFRLAKEGKLLVFVPEAVVYHKHVSSPVNYACRKFRIGYWKVFVAAIHPARLVADSHTPQNMKLEMLLAAASVASCAASPAWKPAQRIALVCTLGFLLSTVPFTARQTAKDPPVAAIAPPMLAIRALALAAGMLAGAIRLALIHLRNGGSFQVQ